jgi:hypothetical protein
MKYIVVVNLHTYDKYFEIEAETLSKAKYKVYKENFKNISFSNFLNYFFKKAYAKEGPINFKTIKWYGRV